MGFSGDCRELGDCACFKCPLHYIIAGNATVHNISQHNFILIYYAIIILHPDKLYAINSMPYFKRRIA